MNNNPNQYFSEHKGSDYKLYLEFSVLLLLTHGCNNSKHGKMNISFHIISSGSGINGDTKIGLWLGHKHALTLP